MIGTTLCHFKITAKLGEGGMGEVYRADDTKLGREVAIKVLPEAVAADPERLARFEREAKVLASLNHPNIAAIYSFESAERAGASPAPTENNVGEGLAPSRGGEPLRPSVHFLVMELVEGEDLKERIDRGPIPLDEAMPIALQVAEALEAAHERGIIHRDLKPGNIKVTPDGKVKVLDFGLAKALDPDLDGANASPASVSMSPTLTAQMTQAGVLLGTAAYMSPEQAAGEPADRQADIWAFGVVVAEMLTGRQQFDGKTASHVLAAVLKEEPDWTRFAATTPPRIVDLVQHCLRKEPTQRLQAIGDARILLQDYLEDPSSFDSLPASAESARVPAWKQVLPWVLFALAAVGLMALWSSRSQPAPASQVFRASILPPEDSTYYLSGWNPGPVAVSPDGTKLAFSIQDETGAVRLYVQALDTGLAEPLPGTESAAYPFWSPDSRWLGFFTDIDQTLKKIDTEGGPPITVCDAENGKGGTWSRDGIILFAPRADSPIHRVPAGGGESTPITEVDGEVHNSHRHPRFLPDGRHYLFLARGGTEEQSALMLGSIDDATFREVVKTPTNAQYSQGWLLYTRGATLMAQPFDTDRLELEGEATPLVEGILTASSAALAIFSTSDTGLLAYNSGELSPEVPLEWVDRSGNTVSTIGEPAVFGPIALSPDGSRAISVIFDSGGIGNLWLTDVETGLRSRFTFEALTNFGLGWSPSGDAVIYSALHNSRFEVNRKSVLGVGETELLVDREEDLILCSVSPDERSILVHQTRPGTNRDLMVLRIDGTGEAIPFRQTEADERCGAFSPDGSWVAYTSNESGRYEIYVTPFPGPGRQWQISDEGGLFPQWRADGREIVYSRQNGELMVAEVRIGTDSLQPGGQRLLFQIHPPRPDGTSFALAPDGERLLVWSNRQRNSETVVNLFVNWPAKLEAP
jgi:serine/threonine protein kinase